MGNHIRKRTGINFLNARKLDAMTNLISKLRLSYDFKFKSFKKYKIK
jgi:hypothetical protein